MKRSTISEAWLALPLGLLLAGSLAVAAPAKQSNGGAEGAGGAASADTDTSTYRLGPEDILEIFVWKEEEVSTTATVRPDGMISIPLLGELRASGRTPAEVQREITEGLQEYLDSPEVSVLVKEINSPKISVLGEVRDPGRFLLRQATNVLDAVAMAGGFTEYADRGDVVVIRGSGSALERHRIDVNDLLKGDHSQLMILQAGDTVYVK